MTTILPTTPQVQRESRPVGNADRKAAVRKASDTPVAPKAEAVADSVSEEQAQQVAEQLHEMFRETTLRFTVRDPSKVKPHNVIIEVVDENDKVVATIPSKEILKLSEDIEKKLSPTLVNHIV